MTQDLAEEAADRPQPHRLRFELIVASLLLAFGLLALPGLIYWVGTLLLGPYGDGAGPGAFYGDFFGDLASGSIRAWTLLLGPLLVVSVIRLLFLSRRPEQAAPPPTAATPQPRPAASADHRRVEPRVSLD